ncbi:glycosyltransferase family 4 protein [bacterium]|nr:glycosyltransferase family 4 protein [bacterium]
MSTTMPTTDPQPPAEPGRTSSPKRILCVEGNFDGTVGGSYYVLYDLVVNLDRSRFQPVVVFYFDNFLVPLLRERGIETHVLDHATPYVPTWKNSANPLLKTVYQLARPLQRLVNISKTLLLPALRWRSFLRRQRIDLVDLNNSVTRNHDWMLGALLAGIPCMTHEMGINQTFSPLSRFFAARMKAIVPVSRAVEANMRRLGLDLANIHTIHNGIDLARYRIHQRPKQVRAAYNIAESRPIIGVIGNIKRWKGQETVIRATRLIKRDVPDICCLLVGGISERDREYYEYLQTLCSELELNEQIVFTGFQEHPLDFMNAMDIVIHPSIDPEPFGIVNLEAMSIKKPVISTTIGAPVEIFTDRVSGRLVEPGNPEALAEACLELLRSPQTAQQMGEAAYRRFQECFTIEKMVTENERIYEQILAGP